MKIKVVIFAVFAAMNSVTAQSTASAGEPIYLNVSSALANKPLDPGTYISAMAYHKRVDQFIPASFKFDNPSFVNGYLLYASGKRSPRMKLNYNAYLRSMFFIDNTKDTFELFPSPDLKYIVTETRLYFHDALTGIYEVTAGRNDKIKLAKKRVFIQTETEPLIGERSYSVNYANETAMYIEYVPHDHKQAKQKITFLKENHFYLTDETENILQANKKGFYKMFPDQQDDIKSWLRAEAKQLRPINFSHENDLVRLLDYCNGLAKK